MATYGVGSALREERLRRQLSLDDIAKQTKIPERFLRAIEADRFETLPGIVFVRNFVRQYAALVEVDPGPLLAALPNYDLETAPLPTPPAHAPESRWDPRWNSALASIAWTVLAGGAAVAAYMHFNRPVHSADVQPHAVAAAQPARQQAVESPKPAADAPPADRGQAEAPAQPASDTQSDGDSTSAEAAAPDVHSNVRVVITARQDSWVRVTADGKTAFIGTLKANDSRSFASDSPIKVRAGNAGGIDITLNGKPIDSLGPTGQPRTVTLTAEGPRVDPETPPPPSPDHA